MIKEIDMRDLMSQQSAEAQLEHLAARAADMSRHLPDAHEIRVRNMNPMTGSPATLISAHASPGSGTLIEQALNHVRTMSSVLGFTPQEVPEFVPDPHIQTTSAGTSIVHLHQHYHGVPIFQMVRAVRFTRQGAVKDVVGDNVQIPGNFETVPSLGVKDAMRALQGFIAPADVTDELSRTDQWGEPYPVSLADMSSYEPEVIATFPLPCRPTILAKGPFGDCPRASLVTFYQGPQMRLGWDFMVTLPEHQGQYEIIVAADAEAPGEILYSQDCTSHMEAQGNVYLVNGDSERQMVRFPRPLTDYPVPLPEDLPETFPGDWVAESQTAGNSTIARLGDSPVTLNGEVNGEVVTFNPSDPFGDDQKLLNIFYYCCYMHDFFYLLGFDERAGNFQEINLTGLGFGGDSVDALAHSGTVPGTANMLTPDDGMNPTMNMGLVTGTNRHTAFSADVVYHEFVHGVTNRFVGGRMNTRALSEPQSRGMGEGWSDYFALTVQNFFRDEEVVTIGTWVVDNANGIRGLPYNDEFPDHFGNIGTGRYGRACGPLGDQVCVHSIGEIWCATLMSMNRRFVEHFGRERGYNAGWRIVADGLRLTRANPSFLDARDGILDALDDLLDTGRLSAADHQAARRAAWQTFAGYGMGPNARSLGASLLGIEADFGVPSD
ncbi:M36 family metallopeptidase [Candidatus Entotheonella palauensis]|uniref:FTP domain-containing protein n=1 Tax=Candidatus Entotheonella gemina TaxID=1429439 RepID=W4M7U3_9BACT|nr:M36 family metallopeptidase [Candidatus Entotheonella palauensis]ETX05991.1 MAG: hypothetical protein ETSY2_19760 [Candidatus Entotheonella gemina]